MDDGNGNGNANGNGDRIAYHTSIIIVLDIPSIISNLHRNVSGRIRR